MPVPVNAAPDVNRRGVSVMLAIGIVLLPYIFSWFTLRKGHSRFSRVLSVTWLSVFIVSNVWVSLRASIHRPNQSATTAAIKAQPIKSATVTPAHETADNRPPANAWTTKESCDMGGALFIKPYLRELLKDPDSLQDFEVVSARPAKKLPGAFKVTVFFRARNSFGSLVPERRTVTVVYNPADNARPWVMVP